MFKDWDAECTAWLIKVIYEAAIKDDRIEGARVFHDIMKEFKEGK